MSCGCVISRRARSRLKGWERGARSGEPEPFWFGGLSSNCAVLGIQRFLRGPCCALSWLTRCLGVSWNCAPGPGSHKFRAKCRNSARRICRAVREMPFRSKNGARKTRGVLFRFGSKLASRRAQKVQSGAGWWVVKERVREGRIDPSRLGGQIRDVSFEE
jgi:hypothetical protein